MIEQLIAVLDGATAGLPIVKRYGIATLIGGAPHYHAGHGDFRPVTADEKGAWSYWRLTGAMRVDAADVDAPCGGVRVTLPLRFVALLERQQCENLPDALLAAMGAISGAKKGAQRATCASTAILTSATIGIDQVADQEYEDIEIPTPRVLVNIDLQAVLIGTTECLNLCQ